DAGLHTVRVAPHEANVRAEPMPEPALRFSATQDKPAGEKPIKRASVSWSRLIVAGWLTGMIGLPAMLSIAYLRFARGLRARPPDDPAWAEEWTSVLASHGVSRTIPLRVSDDLGPMLCLLPSGYQLIVPAWLWQRLAPVERETILKHECAHYLRGDLWKSLA